MKKLIKNCHLISPDKELFNAAIEITDKKISNIYPDGSTPPQANEIIDAKGKMVVPGFIDIHTHGRSGYEFTDLNPEGIKTIGRDKVKEGVTSVVATTLTLPEKTLGKSLKLVAEYMKDENPAGAKMPGVHLEGPYLNCGCLGAQNPAYARKPDIEEVKRLNNIARVLKVSYAIEIEGAKEFTAELKQLGICPSCVHSAANYQDFCEAHDHGLGNLTHFCNQMTPLHHRDIGLVGAGLLHDDISIEMICDRIHLSEAMIALAFKVKGCEKIQLITDAMAASGLPDGESSIGGLEVVIKNGAARLKSNGALAGSTLLYNIALKNVYEITGLPLTQLIKTTSLNQARELNLDYHGKLDINYYADIVILEDDFSINSVFVNGVKKL